MESAASSARGETKVARVLHKINAKYFYSRENAMSKRIAMFIPTIFLTFLLHENKF